MSEEREKRGRNSERGRDKKEEMETERDEEHFGTNARELLSTDGAQTKERATNESSEKVA